MSDPTLFPVTPFARPAVLVREQGLNAIVEIDDHVLAMGGWNDGWCYGHDAMGCELDDEQWDRVYVALPFPGGTAEWVADHLRRFPDRTADQFR